MPYCGLITGYTQGCGSLSQFDLSSFGVMTWLCHSDGVDGIQFVVSFSLGSLTVIQCFYLLLVDRIYPYLSNLVHCVHNDTKSNE